MKLVEQPRLPIGGNSLLLVFLVRPFFLSLNEFFSRFAFDYAPVSFFLS